MGKDHTWNRSKYPVATNTRFNYHYYNGLVVGNYNEFYGKIEKTLINKERTLEMKILNYNKTTYDLRKAIDEVIAKKPGKITVSGYSFNENAKVGVLRIQFQYR